MGIKRSVSADRTFSSKSTTEDNNHKHNSRSRGIDQWLLKPLTDAKKKHSENARSLAEYEARPTNSMNMRNAKCSKGISWLGAKYIFTQNKNK